MFIGSAGLRSCCASVAITYITVHICTWFLALNTVNDLPKQVKRLTFPSLNLNQTEMVHHTRFLEETGLHANHTPKASVDSMNA